MVCLFFLLSKVFCQYLSQDYVYILLLGSIEFPVNKLDGNDNYKKNSFYFCNPENLPLFLK